MPTCQHCKNDLPENQFDRSPDGRWPICRTCAVKYPTVGRATCTACGSSRKLSAFAGFNTSRPCRTCARDRTGDRRLTAALEGAELVAGPRRSLKEISALLRCGPYSRRDAIAAGDLLNEKGYEVSPVGTSRRFAVSVLGTADPTVVPDAIRSAILVPDEETKTVRTLLASVGIDAPSHADIYATSAWLQSAGFAPAASLGPRRYGVSIAPCEPQSIAFAVWAAKYPGALEALELAPATRTRYLNGAPLPAWLRYAMSAAAMGLPAWEG